MSEVWSIHQKHLEMLAHFNSLSKNGFGQYLLSLIEDE